MFRRYFPKEKMYTDLAPQFTHDPFFISFRSWTAVLALDGMLPEENHSGQEFVFLDEKAEKDVTEVIPVKKPVCLRNSTRFSHLNLTIVCSRTKQEIFNAKELPAGRFLNLEFLKEGAFTLYYSPAFSQVTLRRNIQTFAPAPAKRPVPANFHPSLKPTW
jgi:hypothetical protein